MAAGDAAAGDPFAVLGLTPDADGAAVRRAFRERARRTHPDRGGDGAEFLRVAAAYEQLRTPEGRALASRRVREQGAGRRGRPGTPGTSGSPGTAAGTPGTARPAGSRGGPAGDGATRIPPDVQDRLVEDFFRSHPASSTRGPRAGRRPAEGPPAGGPGREPGPARGGRRAPRSRTVVVVLLVLAAAVTLLVPDMLVSVASLVGTVTG